MRLSRFFVQLLLVFLFTRICLAAAPTTAPAPSARADVNLIAMGDWGTNGLNQRQVAAAMASYVQKQGGNFDAALLAGDNFYVPLPGGVNDPLWKKMFEEMYDPKRLNFPFYVSLGNHDYQQGKAAIEMEYSRVNPTSRWKLPSNWYRVNIPQHKPLVSIFMLDSNKDALGPERWKQQLTWIESELSKSNARRARYRFIAGDQSSDRLFGYSRIR